MTNQTQASTKKTRVEGFEIKRKQPGICKLRCVVDMDANSRTKEEWPIGLNNARQVCERRAQHDCPYDIEIKTVEV